VTPVATGGAEAGGAMRLNRYLARCGVSSRRGGDELIKAGSVRVNGHLVEAPGSQVRPGTDLVEVDGHRVELPVDFEYVLLNKAAGLLVTRRDTHGRTTVFDHVDGLRPGTVAVGRLDRDTTGVLLLSDDGELGHRLMHPRYEVGKRYEAVVVGTPSAEAIGRLQRGVELEDGPTSPAEARILGPVPGGHGRRTRLEIRLHEGRKHQVKRMCMTVGHRVTRLTRTEFAGLMVGDLQPGEHRSLQPREVRELAGRVGLARCV